MVGGLLDAIALQCASASGGCAAHPAPALEKTQGQRSPCQAVRPFLVAAAPTQSIVPIGLDSAWIPPAPPPSTRWPLASTNTRAPRALANRARQAAGRARGSRGRRGEGDGAAHGGARAGRAQDLACRGTAGDPLAAGGPHQREHGAPCRCAMPAGRRHTAAAVDARPNYSKKQGRFWTWDASHRPREGERAPSGCPAPRRGTCSGSNLRRRRARVCFATRPPPPVRPRSPSVHNRALRIAKQQQQQQKKSHWCVVCARARALAGREAYYHAPLGNAARRSASKNRSGNYVCEGCAAPIDLALVIL